MRIDRSINQSIEDRGTAGSHMGVSVLSAVTTSVVRGSRRVRGASQGKDKSILSKVRISAPR